MDEQTERRPENQHVVSPASGARISVLPQKKLVDLFFDRLHHLSEGDRQLIYDHWVRQKKVAEIAAERGISRSTVSRQLKQIDTRLAEALTVSHPDRDHLPGFRSAPVIKVDDDGSVSVTVTLDPAEPILNPTDDEWTDEKNERRCDLIDKDIDDSLTPEEAVELELLQQQMLAYRRKVAPMPLEGTRRLHDELSQRARKES